ncbi:MAG: hypothetical protein ABSG41_15295 [Bryobacteraceae bacterium]
MFRRDGGVQVPQRCKVLRVERLAHHVTAGDRDQVEQANAAVIHTAFWEMAVF